MVKWTNIFSSSGNEDSRGLRDEINGRKCNIPDRKPELNKSLAVLPQSETIGSAFPAVEVTKVALRLKYQIEQVIPCELEEWKVTKANSPVITRKVIKTAREAGGKDYKSCVVYCLLVCKRWFKRQASLELWDADLHDVRAMACEVLAKRL